MGDPAAIRAGKAYVEFFVDLRKLAPDLATAKAVLTRYAKDIKDLESQMAAAAKAKDTQQFYHLQNLAGELKARRDIVNTAYQERLEASASARESRSALAERLAAYKSLNAVAAADKPRSMEQIRAAYLERQETAAASREARAALNDRLVMFRALKAEAAGVPVGGIGPAAAGVPITAAAAGAGGFLGTGMGRRDIRQGIRLGLGPVAQTIAPELSGTMAMLASLGAGGAMAAGALLGLGAVVSSVVEDLKEEKKWRAEVAATAKQLNQDMVKALYPKGAMTAQEEQIGRIKDTYAAKIGELNAQLVTVKEGWYLNEMSRWADVDVITAKMAQMRKEMAEAILGVNVEVAEIGRAYRVLQGVMEEHSAAVARKAMKDRGEQEAELKRVGGDRESVAANAASHAATVARTEAEDYRAEKLAMEEHNAAVDRRRFTDKQEQEAELKRVGGDRESVMRNAASARDIEAARLDAEIIERERHAAAVTALARADAAWAARSELSQRGSSRGDFNVSAIWGWGTGMGPVLERIAKATEETARNTAPDEGRAATYRRESIILTEDPNRYDM